MKLEGLATTVPDHSHLQWDVMIEREVEHEAHIEKSQGDVNKYVVPEDYIHLKGETLKIEDLRNRLHSVEKDQRVLDEIGEIVALLKKGLVEKKRKGGRRGQPCFTREITNI